MSLPERKLIEKIRRAAGRKPGPAVLRGIGDDCAVLNVPRGHEVLVTTDFSLENIHFRREWHSPESVGHRCLTRGLSDIAAMGGDPVAAFLSLALPGDTPQEWVDGFLRGFTKLARKFNVVLAGGDTAQSPMYLSGNSPTGRPQLQGPILADVMVLGSVPRGKAVLRSGAKVGDDIFVTGKLGASASVLHRLMEGSDSDRAVIPTSAKGGQMRGTKGIGTAASRAHFFPAPRIAVARWLRERGLASAMIDISDGISTDLSHICEESNVGAWIPRMAVPVAEGATLDEALNGGEDYELLFTVRPAKHDRIPDKIEGVPIRWMGTVTRPEGMWIVRPDMKSREPLLPRGWEHFRE